MSVRNYILSKFLSGTTKNNVEMDITQLSLNGSYAIDNPKDVISEEIYVSLSGFLDPKYSIYSIRGMLDTDGKHKLSCYDDGMSSLVADYAIISVDNEKKTYFYEVHGNFRSRRVYKVSEIEDAKVGYMVSEHIIAPEPGVPLIERVHVPIFRDLEKALRYKRQKMKSYHCSRGAENSGYRITVVDISEMIKSDWYKKNLEIYNDITKYELNEEDYRYIADLDEAKMAVFADAYDELTPIEQSIVNMHIFEEMRPYISAEYLPFLTEDLEDADAAEIEEVADDAILYALINAQSAEQFAEIHKKLGPNDYRVGALTDAIYQEHPDVGYIVLTVDGNFGWYPEVYAINEWEGSKDSPYHGVFQKNWADTLLCLKEYHPELIVKNLPTKAEVEKYNDMYQETLATERRKHSEFKFGYNDYEGRPTVTGDWYYDGLKSSNVLKNITFYRDYGEYVFSKEECLTLLNGDEITIENYKTKSGKELTIRGKLRDCSDIDADYVDVQFARTDIDPENRARMYASLGIEGGIGGI